ncbi:hypothetical protein V2H45_23945 [Tumidithrix elongata RA019]|uniref:Uncharacterized protein n=1 Tax=Tumidithrix elongata BACA0141 TaxID=2716417 RepID=A0AAW9Q8E4_9CYAN|nr:hypothetical protein [Tumidithrix elongata RA019]
MFGLAFSADSDMIASASSDKTMKIWNINKALKQYKKDKLPVKKLDDLQILRGHTNILNRIEFNPVFHVNLGSSIPMIASSSNDGTVRLWNWRSGLEVQDASDTKTIINKSCNAFTLYTQGYLKQYQKEINNICN